VTSGAGPSLPHGSNEHLAGRAWTGRPLAAARVSRAGDRESRWRRGVRTTRAGAPAPFFSEDAARAGLAGRDEALGTVVRARRLR